MNNIIEEKQLWIKLIPETTWAYFSGMLDGEGHVSIIRHKKPNPSKRGYEIETMMNLSGMDIESISQLQRLIGYGKIVLVKHKRQCGIITVAYLRFSVSEQRLIIPKVLPYLMQKKERLEIIKSFLEYRLIKNKPFEERELKYYQFEKQFEDAMFRAKPWMLLTPIAKKGRPHKPVTPPKIIEHLFNTSKGEKHE
jgi:hypothetical protein